MIKSIQEQKLGKQTMKWCYSHIFKRTTNPHSDKLGHQDVFKKCFPENWASTAHPDAHLAKSFVLMLSLLGLYCFLYMFMLKRLS